MAFSAQKEFYNARDLSILEDGPKNAGTLKRYQSCTDPSAWALSRKKRSQFIRDVITARRIPTTPRSGGGDSPDEDLKHLSNEQLREQILALKKEIQKKDMELSKAQEIISKSAEENAQKMKEDEQIQVEMAQLMSQYELLESEFEKRKQRLEEKVSELEQKNQIMTNELSNSLAKNKSMEKEIKKKEKLLTQKSSAMHDGKSRGSVEGSFTTAYEAEGSLDGSQRSSSLTSRPKTPTGKGRTSNFELKFYKEKYKETEKKLDELRNKYLEEKTLSQKLQVEKSQFELELRKADQQVDELLLIMDRQDVEIQDRDAYIISMRTQLKQVDEASKDLNAIKDIVRKSIEESELRPDCSKCKSLMNEISNLRDELENSRQQSISLSHLNGEEIENAKKETSRLSTEVERLLMENMELSTSKEMFESAIDELKDQLNNERNEIETLVHQNRELKECLECAGTEFTGTECSIMELDTYGTVIEEAIKQLEVDPKKAVTDLKKTLDGVQKDLKCLQKQNRELKKQMLASGKKCPEDCEKILAENCQLRKDIKALKDSLAEVENVTSALENQTTQRKSLELEYQAALQAKEKEQEEKLLETTEQLNQKLEEMEELKSQLADMEALTEEREKSRKKLLRDNEKYINELKAREEYVEKLQDTIKSLNEDLAAEREKNCQRDESSRGISNDMCELLRKLKDSWDAAYTDKIEKLKQFYEEKIEKLMCQKGCPTGSYSVNSCGEFAALCERILTNGLEDLVLNELMFLHEEIYGAIMKLCPCINTRSDLVLMTSSVSSKSLSYINDMSEIPIRLPKETTTKCTKKRKLKKSCSKKFRVARKSKCLGAKGSNCGTSIIGRIISKHGGPGHSF